MFYYWAYGMNIESAMEIPEMLPHRGTSIDLKIRFGKAPNKIPDTPLKEIGSLQMSADHFRLELPIGTYYVREGKEIIVDTKPNADDKSLRLFLLANAMAAVLHQRLQVALHAGAIKTKQGLILVCGHSGAGKSTTISALRQKGYQPFTDDVVVLSQEGTKITGTASYPIVKLWQDSIEKLQIADINEGQRIRDQIPKYQQAFHDEFSKDTTEIKEVYFLEKKPGSFSPTMESLQGVRAFQYLKEGLYQNTQAHSAAYNEHLFRLLAIVCEEIPLHLITRGESTNSIEEVVGLITKNIH